MEITVNPLDLSDLQRKMLAEFILNFPGAAALSAPAGQLAERIAGDLAAKTSADAAQAAARHIGMTPVSSVTDYGPELAQLAVDAASPATPEQAFGNLAADLDSAAAAAAFGGAVAPVVPTIPQSTPAGPAPVADTAPTTTTPGLASSGAPAAPVASSVEVDSKGLPWDSRIHAGTKRKNADGSWTAKRGVDAAVVTEVEAQLRQVMAAPSPAPVAPAAPVAPVAPAAPGIVSQIAASVYANEQVTFKQLVQDVGAALAGGKLTQQEVADACQKHGVPALPLLSTRLDIVPTVAADIRAILSTRG